MRASAASSSGFPASPGAGASLPPSGPASSDSARLARLPDVVHQLAVHPGAELGQREVEVLGPGPQVRGEEVAEVGRVEGVERRPRGDQRAARLGHLLAVQRQVAVHVQPGRPLEARDLEHRGPEQRVEVDDVLPDEVADLGVRVLRPEVHRRARRAPSPWPTSRWPRCSRSARPARRRRTCPSPRGWGSRSTARPG